MNKKTKLTVLAFAIVLLVPLSRLLYSWEDIAEFFIACPPKTSQRSLGVTRFSIHPNGTKLLYDFNGGLYEIDLHSFKIMELQGARLKEEEVAVSGSYSPDGNTVIYTLASKRPILSCPADIYSLSLITGKRTRLTYTRVYNDTPSFSPDASQIVFARSHRLAPGTFGPFVGAPRFWTDWDLYLMNADGSNEKRITFQNYDWIAPLVWSPDGKNIVFTAPLPTNAFRLHQVADIIMVDSNGRFPPKDLTQGYLLPSPACQIFFSPYGSSNPLFLPDGSKIIYLSYRGSECDHPYQIWIMNSDGSNQRLVTNLEVYPSLWVLSPDGKRIYFMNYYTVGEYKDKTIYELWVMDASGKNPHRLSSLGLIDRRSQKTN